MPVFHWYPVKSVVLRLIHSASICLYLQCEDGIAMLSIDISVFSMRKRNDPLNTVEAWASRFFSKLGRNFYEFTLVLNLSTVKLSPILFIPPLAMR